jgi:hypothetical protein
LPEKIGRNEPCPCGSGQKYKNCCLGKAAVDTAIDIFQKKFGVESGLNDRFAQHQQETQLKMIAAMKQNGMDPAFVYAVEKTGVMVFQETMHLIPAEDLERFNKAYEQYQP